MKKYFFRQCQKQANKRAIQSDKRTTRLASTTQGKNPAVYLFSLTSHEFFFPKAKFLRNLTVMKPAQFRKYGILAQIGLILIFFLINFMEHLSYYDFIEAVIYSLNYTFMVVIVAYIHYFLVFPMYLKGRRFIYFFTTFLVVTFFISFYYLIDYALPFEIEENDWQNGEILQSLTYDYLLHTLIIGTTSLYYFVEQWFKNITTESQLRNEKLQAELNFLKSQINPHFLFNTLNNIYSYAQTGNHKTAPMLERLSSILRFMVYDCGENRVGLSKEVTAVEDLLEIQKMKNSKQQNIELKIEGVKGFHLIAPLIIVNFVENACKHSDVVNNSDGFIHIKISVDESDNCVLNITNTFKKKIVVDSKYGGVGLGNIKKRLELQYGENYTLKEEKSKGVYYLNLKIPLERKK